MNDFLNDLWNDLREKRLWPVAALLLVGLIAVPVVLSKPTEEPAAVAVVAPEAPRTPSVARGLAALTVAEDDGRRGLHARRVRSEQPVQAPEGHHRQLRRDRLTVRPRTGTGRHRRHRQHAHRERPERARAADTGTGGTTPTPSRRRPIEYRYVIDATFTTNGEKRKIEA